MAGAKCKLRLAEKCRLRTHEREEAGPDEKNAGTKRALLPPITYREGQRERGTGGDGEVEGRGGRQGRISRR